VATLLYDVTITGPRRWSEKVSAHLDVEGDQDTLRAELRRLLLDGVQRSGWAKRSAPEFKLTVRRPGWAKDAIEPYVIPQEEV